MSKQTQQFRKLGQSSKPNSPLTTPTTSPGASPHTSPRGSKKSVTPLKGLGLTPKNSKTEKATAYVDDTSLFGSQFGVDDMTNLDDLTDQIILRNILLRFSNDKIYTYIGSILLAVNPYKNLPIYSEKVAASYNRKPLGACPPHIYAIADFAYQALVSDQSKEREFLSKALGRDQSIIVSGDSGSGKTETIKYILSYISSLSPDKGEHLLGFSIQDRVLTLNPILEAFGNAKTILNHNSSRFGKLLQLQFDEMGNLLGGKTQNYLLEKTRVTYQPEGERNFHIFYYICAGADKAERDHWQIFSSNDFEYTSQDIEVKLIDSRIEYPKLKQALSVAGISPADQHQFFTLYAAILHLGNLKFDKDDKDAAVLTNPDAASWVAYLLQIDSDALKLALTKRQYRVGNEMMQSARTVIQAYDVRDALARQLYDRQFSHIVDLLNLTTICKHPEQVKKKINLLDIFGFEVFHKNSFEQFLINYANERLQFLFNDHIFTMEQSVYKSEGLDLKEFKFTDNHDTIELIESKPLGIIHILTEESRLNTATDATFLSKLTSAHQKNIRYGVGFTVKTKNTHFSIDHYAGKAEYDVDTFIEKNRESFPSSIISLIQKSKNSYFCSLFVDFPQITEIDDSKAVFKKTASLNFQEQLVSLMKLLRDTNTHFIRCIKPNSIQAPIVVEKEDIFTQLQCSGVLETIRIRKGGFPNRRVFEDFISRYSGIVDMKVSYTIPQEQLKNLVTDLAEKLDIKKAKFRLGKTQVFLKDDVFHRLEGAYTQHYYGAALRIQSAFRQFSIRRRYLKIQSSTVLLQTWLRYYLRKSDRSGKVAAAVVSFAYEAKKSPANFTKSLQKMKDMVVKDQDVDAIVSHGGVDVIVDALTRAADNEDVVEAGVHMLGRLSLNPEHAAKVARKGAVSAMIRSINSSSEGKNSEASFKLLEQLGSVAKNAELLIREGGVRTLISTLVKHTNTDSHSPSAVAAARALNVMLQNPRLARVIGQDYGSIMTLLNAIKQKPKFTQLISYSLRCLASLAGNDLRNSSAIIEMGGLDILKQVMTYHTDTPAVFRDCVRALLPVSKEPSFAKMIGDAGIIELCVEYIKKTENPEDLSEVLELLNGLLNANSENVKKLLGTKFIPQLVKICKKSNDVQLNRSILSVLEKLSQFDEACTEMIEEKFYDVCVTKMSTLIKDGDCIRSLINILSRLALANKDIYDVIRAQNIVEKLSLAMEYHARNKDLIGVGAKALKIFSNREDLENAIAAIAASRLESKATPESQKKTNRAVAILSNLALLDENIDIIVNEGGISLLLAIINGAILLVGSDPSAAAAICSAGRALQRLMVKPEHQEELVREGGIETFIGCIVTLGKYEGIVDVSTSCLSCIDPKHLLDRDAIKHIIRAIKLYPKAPFVPSALAALNNCCTFSDEGRTNFIENGGFEALSTVLLHADSEESIMAAISFIKNMLNISRARGEVVSSLVSSVLDGLMRVLILYENNDSICSTILDITSSFASFNSECMQLCQKSKVLHPVVRVMLNNFSTHNCDFESIVFKKSIQLLASLAYTDNISAALMALKSLSAEFANDTSKVNLLAQIQYQVGFLSAVASDPSKLQTMLDYNFVEDIYTTLVSVGLGKESTNHEKALEALALCFCYMADHFDLASEMVRAGVPRKLVMLMDAFPMYEVFVQTCLLTLKKIAAHSQFLPELVNAKLIPLLAMMVRYHPLNEKILIDSGILLAQLLKSIRDPDELAEAKAQASPSLLVCLRTAQTNPPLFMQILQVVKDVVDSDTFVAEENQETLAALIALLSKTTTTLPMKAGICDLFTNYMSDDTFARAFTQHNGIGEIIKLLRSFTNDSLFNNNDQETISALRNVLHAALGTLQSICKHESNHKELQDHEVIKLIIQLMQTHKDDARTIAGCFDALDTLSLNNDFAPIISVRDNIRLFIALLRQHSPPSIPIATSFCHLMINLAKNEDLLKILFEEKVDQEVRELDERFNHNEYITDLCKQVLLAMGIKDEPKVVIVPEVKEEKPPTPEPEIKEVIVPEVKEEKPPTPEPEIKEVIVPEVKEEKPPTPEPEIKEVIVPEVKEEKPPTPKPKKAIIIEEAVDWLSMEDMTEMSQDDVDAEMDKMMNDKRLKHYTKNQIFDTIDLVGDGKIGKPLLIKSLKILLEMHYDVNALKQYVHEDTIEYLIDVLNKNKRDAGIVRDVCLILDKFADEPSALKEFIACGGPTAVVRAVKLHTTFPLTLLAGIILIGHLAKDDHIRVLLGLQGAIDFVITCMTKFPDYLLFIVRCVYALSNLAHKCQANMAAIVKAHGIQQIITAMLDYFNKSIELLDCGSVCLSNLCYRNTHNCVLIAKEGGCALFTRIIDTYFEKKNLIITSCNTVSDIASAPENIELLNKHKTSNGILKVIQRYPTDVDVVLVALEAVVNLTVGEIPDLQVLINSNTIQIVANAALTHKNNVKIMHAAVHSLTNLARDPTALDSLINNNIMILISYIFLNYSDDIPLIELALLCIQAIAVSPIYIGLLVAASVPLNIASLIRKHMQNIPLLKKALETINRLVQSNENAVQLVEQRVIEILLEVITNHQNNDDILTLVLNVLISVAIVESTAVRIAQLTLLHIIQAIKRHPRKQVFLRTAATVIGNLSLFNSSASALIAQTDFFYEIVTAISVNSDYPSILIQFIKALSALIATSDKAIAPLEANNAVMIVRKAGTKHPKHEQLQEVIAQFVKRIHNEDDDVKRLRGNRPLTIAEQLPPGIKSMLQAGTIFQWHSDSQNPKNIHLRASENFESIQWSEGSAKGSKIFGSIPMSMVTRIQPGACTPALKRKRMFSAPPDPTKVFAIIIDSSKQNLGFSLSLEANDHSGVSSWLKALLLLQKLNSAQYRFKAQEIFTTDVD